MPKKAANSPFLDLVNKLRATPACAVPVKGEEALALHICEHEMAASLYRLFEKIPRARQDMIAKIVVDYLKGLFPPPEQR